MSHLESFNMAAWNSPISIEEQKKAVQALETGKVLFFPSLAFPLDANERKFLSPAILNPKSKNISYDGAKGLLAGANAQGLEEKQLQEMMKRYFIASRHFLEKIIPHYAPNLVQGKTSFRPVEIEGRKTSYRKDDSRLHIDAFPSNPTKGRRILRVFTNINLEGKGRVWRLGEPMRDVFHRYLPKVKEPMWGSSSFLKWLGITKDYRTLYDHYMLKVHDTMKGDEHYQKNVPQEKIVFQPGCTWIVYTDQVSHAAMSGQHVLEQTFHISPQGLKNEATAPLRVMEKLLNKALI